MTGHRKTRLLLYDFLRGAAAAGDARSVADHLAACARCAAEAESLRAFLVVAPDGAQKPSAALDDAFWSRFADEVAGRIVDEVAGRIAETPLDAPRLPDRLLGAIGITRRTVTPGGFSPGIPSVARRLAPVFAALAVAAIVIYLTVPYSPGGSDSPQGGQDGIGEVQEIATETLSDVPSDSLTDFDRRLNDYFKRSKALLVGVSNLDPPEGGAVDLDAERRVSRSLLREARYLRGGPIDPRSYRLLSDLDQIMLGLANSDAAHAHPAVDIIREGIGEKNLLFKLRVQETTEYRTPFVQASFKQ